MISKCESLVNVEGRELATHGNISFPVAAYDDDISAMSVPWHWHEELEAVLAVSGSGIVAFGTQKIKLHKGEGLFINSEVLHTAWSDESDGHFHSLVFHSRLLGGNEYSIFWEKYLKPLMRGVKFLHFSGHDEWQKKAIKLIEDAWNYCESEEYGYEFFVREKLSNLILLIDMYAPTRTEVSISEHRRMRRIKIMLSFIHEHFRETLTNETIANSASISESECLRCFNKVLGTTLAQYLKRYRLSKSESMLLTSELPISDIAYQSGFQELSYFSKIFREKNGVTPSEYRRSKETEQSPY